MPTTGIGKCGDEPTQPKSLVGLLATLAPIDEDFPPIEDTPPDPVDL
jgi:hypothetical protein